MSATDVVAEPAFGDGFEAAVAQQGFDGGGELLAGGLVAFAHGQAQVVGRGKGGGDFDGPAVLFDVVLGDEVFFEDGIHFLLRQCVQALLDVFKPDNAVAKGGACLFFNACADQDAQAFADKVVKAEEVALVVFVLDAAELDVGVGGLDEVVFAAVVGGDEQLVAEPVECAGLQAGLQRTWCAGDDLHRAPQELTQAATNVDVETDEVVVVVQKTEGFVVADEADAAG